MAGYHTLMTLPNLSLNRTCTKTYAFLLPGDSDGKTNTETAPDWFKASAFATQLTPPPPPPSAKLWWFFELTLYRHLCSCSSSVNSAFLKELHSSHYCLSAIFHASWFSVTNVNTGCPRNLQTSADQHRLHLIVYRGYNQGKSLALVILIEWLFSMLYWTTVRLS